ncbi:MAG: hypothetical protein ACE37B_06240 [Ilumatobacter sp.]|jgi:hypothetical protein|uniref:hypothetical protein n=1 Tax=Ilumatobacter sp. TaxID=1967498 RepID=UPI00391A38E0
MTLLRTTTDELRISDELAEALPRIRRVAVTTGRGDDKAARVRRIATEIAADQGWEIILYDRSQERWTDHPHPTGPLRADDLDADGFDTSEFDTDDLDHLRVELRDIEAAGVSAAAWIATIPSLTAMIDVFQEVEIDAVLLPADPDKPRLMERLLSGDDVAETVERVTQNLVPGVNPYFLVVDDDEIRIETYGEAS